MAEEVDYDSDTGGRDSPVHRNRSVKVKGRGHARFNRGGDHKGRGGQFETIDQTGAEEGGPAHCKLTNF